MPDDPTPQNRAATMNGEAVILREVQSLRTELTAAFARGQDELSAQIRKVGDSHTSFIIEQERRNSEFATRDRVEDVARNVHQHGNTLTTLTLKLGMAEREITTFISKQEAFEQALQTHREKILVELSAIRDSVSSGWIGSLTRNQGYLIGVLLMLAGIVIGFIFNHLSLPAAPMPVPTPPAR